MNICGITHDLCVGLARACCRTHVLPHKILVELFAFVHMLGPMCGSHLTTHQIKSTRSNCRWVAVDDTDDETEDLDDDSLVIASVNMSQDGGGPTAATVWRDRALRSS